MHTIQRFPSPTSEIVLGITLDAGARGRGEFHHVRVLVIDGVGMSTHVHCDRCKGDQCKACSLTRALLSRDMVPILQGRERAELTSATGRSRRRPRVAE